MRTIKLSEPKSDCLIIVRAGDTSLHRSWRNAHCRPFDLFVSYFGDTEKMFLEDADHYHVAKGPRWPAHHDICERHWELLSKYKYIGLPCDDIEASPNDWERLFGICDEYRLDLAQPAIDGVVTYEFTRPSPGSLLRFTNWVEIMTPIFRVSALKKIKHTFTESKSGWGLNWIWPSVLPFPEHRLAIIDSVPVGHERPLWTGQLYQVLKGMGVDSKKEMAEVLARNGITKLVQQEYARINAETGELIAVS